MLRDVWSQVAKQSVMELQQEVVTFNSKGEKMRTELERAVAERERLEALSKSQADEGTKLINGHLLSHQAAHTAQIDYLSKALGRVNSIYGELHSRLYAYEL